MWWTEIIEHRHIVIIFTKVDEWEHLESVKLIIKKLQSELNIVLSQMRCVLYQYIILYIHTIYHTIYSNLFLPSSPNLIIPNLIRIYDVAF